MPICWYCRAVGDLKAHHLLRCESQGILRVDFDRAGRDVVCECGKKYRDHPADADYNFLTVLCDGSLVKL